jgi:hypothetical protein
MFPSFDVSPGCPTARHGEVALLIREQSNNQFGGTRSRGLGASSSRVKFELLAESRPEPAKSIKQAFV